MSYAQAQSIAKRHLTYSISPADLV